MKWSAIVFGILGAYLLPPVARAIQILPDIDPTTAGWPELLQVVSHLLKLFMTTLIPTVAMVIFLWASFLLITAAGDSKQISKAKSLYVNGAIGLLIVFSAVILLRVFVNTVGLGTGAFPFK